MSRTPSPAKSTGKAKGNDKASTPTQTTSSQSGSISATSVTSGGPARKATRGAAKKAARTINAPAPARLSASTAPEHPGKGGDKAAKKPKEN